MSQMLLTSREARAKALTPKLMQREIEATLTIKVDPYQFGQLWLMVSAQFDAGMKPTPEDMMVFVSMILGKHRGGRQRNRDKGRMAVAMIERIYLMASQTLLDGERFARFMFKRDGKQVMHRSILVAAAQAKLIYDRLHERFRFDLDDFERIADEQMRRDTDEEARRPSS